MDVFFQIRARSLEELEEQFVSDAESRQLDAAYDFLLRTRTELHYHINRPMDVLGKNLQPAVALGLGWHDRSPSLRIEKFMRELYMHMRNIFLITRTLEQRMALVPEKGAAFPCAAGCPNARRLRRWTVSFLPTAKSGRRQLVFFATIRGG